MLLTHQTFKKLLPSICGRETSFEPEGWTQENPLWGHCSVVSLIAYDTFGGTFVSASLDNTPFAYIGSHIWIILPSGEEHDFTKEQFGNTELKLIGKRNTSDGQQIDREYLLRDPDIKRRYELLSCKLEKHLKIHKLG